MLVIKVSYENELELESFILLNKQIIKSVKRQPASGKYKRAYIQSDSKKLKQVNEG